MLSSGEAVTSPLERFSVIPYARLTPEACDALVERLSATRELLEQWGVRKALSSRLRDADATLRAVAKTRSFGTTSEELLRTIDAIALTVDFFQIAQCLGPDSLDEVARELTRAIALGLTGTRSERQAVEFQTQYWMGMVLASAGLAPLIPRKRNGGKTPDFVFDLKVFELAVEVKRPETTNSMVDALDRAADQIRAFGKPGLLAVDLTDCLISRSDRLAAIETRRLLSVERQERFFRGFLTWRASLQVGRLATIGLTSTVES